MNIITLGSDPEFACFDTKTKKYISLVGKFEGTKEKPQVIESLPDCCNLIDCCGLEFTMDPTKTLGELFDKINTLINYHNKVLQEMNPNWVLKAVSSAEYDPDQLDSPEANTFGCEPSYSIYKGESMRSVEQAGNIRSFGFHLHWGFDIEPTTQQLEDFVFLCDLFLGLPSIIYDKDVNRRRIFGNLGDFRPKPKYPGLEYRVMGIGMLEHFDVINQGIKYIQDALDRNLVPLLKEQFWGTMISIDDNIKIINKLKVEKVYHDILRLRNSQERVQQPLPSTQG